MPIDFTCPHCGTRTNVDDAYAGMSGPCAGCDKEITIPAAGHPFEPRPFPSRPSPSRPFPSQPSADISDNAAIRMLLPVGRSGWAIAAGYAGLFAFLFFPAPLALILGIVAVFHIKKNPKLHGMGRAVFGLVMGLLGTVFLLFIFIAMLMG